MVLIARFTYSLMQNMKIKYLEQLKLVLLTDPKYHHGKSLLVSKLNDVDVIRSYCDDL